MVETMYWADDALYLLDQRALPNEVTYVKCGRLRKFRREFRIW